MGFGISASAPLIFSSRGGKDLLFSLEQDVWLRRIEQDFVNGGVECIQNGGTFNIMHSDEASVS